MPGVVKSLGTQSFLCESSKEFNPQPPWVTYTSRGHGCGNYSELVFIESKG